MKPISVLLSFLFLSIYSYADAFKIPLNDFDQAKLTAQMSKLDYKYRSEEVINQNLPNWFLLKKYNFLTPNSAFYINCSEEFHQPMSTVGINQKCEIGFNYGLSSSDLLDAHDGFIDKFAIAEIKDQSLSRDLYNSFNIQNLENNFFSKEQLTFTHPVTGNNFLAFRLRIACKRDATFESFSCIVYATK